MNPGLALVTGAPGWLGSRVVEALVKGLADLPSLRDGMGERRVRCLVLPGADSSALTRISDRIELVTGDLTEPASLDAFVRDADGATLFHSAGVIHPTRRAREWRAINVDGTKNLLDAAKRARVKRFVHVSSNSPIGMNRHADDVFDEDSPYNPYMGYGNSKRLAEELVLEAGKAGPLEVVIVRPPWFYGPGQPPRQTLFFSMVKNGKAPIVGGGDNRRSMAYVDNICQGLLLCERVDQAKGGIYWIADKRPYSMNEIIDTIERVLERDFQMQVAHKRLHLPGIASGVARLVDGAVQAIGLYNQKVHVLSEMNQTIACTVARAQRELGYDPKVELEEGMRRSVAWMLDHGMSV
jgi:nucleoside-diphosphate-sugar epimerase